METGSARPKAGLIDCVGLRWFFRLLSSSIGQKFVMGITGLLLCGFLAAHLAGNLLLFAGAELFNDYAHKLHEQWELLIVAETGLAVLFLAHIYLAFATAAGNGRAREDDYAMKQPKVPGRVIGANTWMFASGAVVLGFVLLHLVDLRLGMEGIDLRGLKLKDMKPFDATVKVLSNPISRVVYTIGAIILGIHLSHGFSSAFQSLGLNHPKYTPMIKLLGKIFAFVIAVGFASLALFVPEIWRK
ncbi:MAG: succinate dehydrogenase cytochrome b subunit [Planctomycetes bacterium]|nr:succinate dehydrogenase cytochrome b subunit [Planctomycetota bacterium]